MLNHASTLAFAWYFPEDGDFDSPEAMDQMLAGLFAKLADLILDRDEAREALLTDMPFDSFEDEDAKALSVDEEALKLFNNLAAFMLRD